MTTTETTTTNLTDQEWVAGSDTETVLYYFTTDESVVWSDVAIAAHRIGLTRSVPMSTDFPIAVTSGSDDRGHWVAVDETDAPILRAMIAAATEARATAIGRLGMRTEDPDFEACDDAWNAAVADLTNRGLI